MNLSRNGFLGIALDFAIIEAQVYDFGPARRRPFLRDSQGQADKALMRISGQQMEAKKIK